MSQEINKKRKAEKELSEISDSESEEENDKEKNKKDKKKSLAIKEGDGYYFELEGGKKRLTLSKYQGKKLIQIREFYSADGQMKPGKNGISLNLNQLNEIKNFLPELEKLFTKY